MALDDGDDFIVGSSLLRNSIQRAMKEGKTQGSASIIFSSSIFSSIFSTASFKEISKLEKYGALKFTPPATLSDLGLQSFVEDYSEKPTLTCKNEVANFREGTTKSITLKTGTLAKMKQILKKWIQKGFHEDLLNYVTIEDAAIIKKEKRKSLTMEEIQELEQKIGKFTSKSLPGMIEDYLFIDQKREGDSDETPEIPKFIVKYFSSTSKLKIQFSFINRL